MLRDPTLEEIQQVIERRECTCDAYLCSNYVVQRCDKDGPIWYRSIYSDWTRPEIVWVTYIGHMPEIAIYRYGEHLIAYTPPDSRLNDWIHAVRAGKPAPPVGTP